MEEWRDIPGFAGYQVSSIGRVRSLPRTVTQMSPHGSMMVRVLKGKILAGNTLPNGYRSVMFGRRSRCHLIHRLVALAFVNGHADGLVVNHKNGVRHDNSAENPEWLTHGDNHRHSYRELTRKPHAWTRKVVLTADGEQHVFDSLHAAAKAIGVTNASISSAAIHAHKTKGYEVHYI